jgi:hypothetical protein
MIETLEGLGFDVNVTSGGEDVYDHDRLVLKASAQARNVDILHAVAQLLLTVTKGDWDASGYLEEHAQSRLVPASAWYFLTKDLGPMFESRWEDKA